MNPLLLFGGIAGAMTSGGALSVINDQSRTTVAGIGFTGVYVFAIFFISARIVSAYFYDHWSSVSIQQTISIQN
ncbi:MAG: hypothetical protein KAR17_19900 [Cyclobacteriaceae bacterium]|nr:hypothetical protein [Cyclobacteriaceae bacterium]MCK5279254.1 hypothetical protein [Cyclobacteriaceae bacterium]